jgi:transposase
MLNNATCFTNIYIVCGRTDLRFGIDRLAGVLRANGIDNPMIPDTLYLFCGRRTDRIKGLVWERDGYLLLYKRLEAGSFQWPSQGMLQRYNNLQTNSSDGLWKDLPYSPGRL